MISEVNNTIGSALSVWRIVDLLLERGMRSNPERDRFGHRRLAHPPPRCTRGGLRSRFLTATLGNVCPRPKTREFPENKIRWWVEKASRVRVA